MTDWQTLLIETYQNGFKPPFTGSIDQWAEKNINLQSGYSITGQFDCSISPHFRKIFAAIKDPYVREINILAPPRSGKTLIAELSLLHTIAHNSGDVLWLTLSDEKATQMAELRMIPLIKSCEPVNSLLSTDKYNVQNQKFKFLHSTVHITSPKENALNSVGYKFIFADEVWKYPGASIIKDIKHRSDDYLGVNKAVFFSQGGVKDSAWYEQYKAGEQWEYGFRCPKCSELQTFEFTKKRSDGTTAGIVWPASCKNHLGDWIIRDCAKQAMLECFHCRYQITDEPQNREWLMEHGDWIKVGGENEKVKSFRFTNLQNRKISFGELTTRYLEAKQKVSDFSSTEDLEQFITKDCADFWDNSIQKSRSEIILSNYNTDNPFGEQEEFRFLTVDCQQVEPFFWYVCRSWTRHSESRLVSFGKCNTWAEVNAIRERNKVDYRFVFVDTGDGNKTESHLSEMVKNGRWANLDGEEIWTCYHSLKGSGQKGFRHKDNKFYRYNEPIEYFIATTDEEDRGKSVPHVTWSNLRYKTILEALRDGKGKRWEAADVTEEYTQHLNSEVLQRKLKGNTADFEYIPRSSNAPNHLWDCEAMQIVAADLFGCLETAEIQANTESN